MSLNTHLQKSPTNSGYVQNYVKKIMSSYLRTEWSCICTKYKLEFLQPNLLRAMFGEICPVFIDKLSIYFCFLDISVAFYLIRKSPVLKDEYCQVWLKFTQWFNTFLMSSLYFLCHN